MIFVAYFDCDTNPLNVRLSGHDPSPSHTHTFYFHTDFPTIPDLATFQIMAFDVRGSSPNPDVLISRTTPTATPTIYLFAGYESHPLTESSRNHVFTLFEAIFHPWG
jgi:hypothetical protein